MYRFQQFVLCCFLFLLFNRNVAGKIELYSRLNLLVNYVVEHEASQTPDLMLGVYLCEGNSTKFKVKHHIETSTITTSQRNWWHSIWKWIERHLIWRRLCERKSINCVKLMKRMNKCLAHGAQHHRTQLVSVIAGGVRLFFHTNGLRPHWVTYLIKLIRFVTVTRHLVSSRFWSGLVKNVNNRIYGNLTPTQPVTITLENFSNRIDIGSPTPEESGKIENIFYLLAGLFSFVLIIPFHFRWLPRRAFESTALYSEQSLLGNYVTKRWIAWISFNSQVIYDNFAQHHYTSAHISLPLSPSY